MLRSPCKQLTISLFLFYYYFQLMNTSFIYRISIMFAPFEQNRNPKGNCYSCVTICLLQRIFIHSFGIKLLQLLQLKLCKNGFHFSVQSIIRVCFALVRYAIGWKNSRHPIRIKTNDLLALVFPRLASATCINFELWLVHWIVCVLCDWPEWWLCFWFSLKWKPL